MQEPAGAIATDGKEWASWGHDAHNTRFQTEPGFTAADLPRLKVKWAFALPGLTGAPTVAGDHLFVTSRMGKVFSLDAKTGCTYWSYQADGPIRNGVAVGHAGRMASSAPISATSMPSVHALRRRHRQNAVGDQDRRLRQCPRRRIGHFRTRA